MDTDELFPSLEGPALRSFMRRRVRGGFELAAKERKERKDFFPLRLNRGEGLRVRCRVGFPARRRTL